MPARTQRSGQVDVAAHARRSSAAFGRSGDVAGKTAGKVRRSRALAFAGRGVDRPVAGRRPARARAGRNGPLSLYGFFRPSRCGRPAGGGRGDRGRRHDGQGGFLCGRAILDVASRIEIMELLHRLARLQRKTVLLSTHDVEQALRLSDRIWLLSRAEGFCCGTPEDLALSGRMDLYFGRGGLFFDRQAGGLRSRQDDAPAVRFEAADEALARWTKNALERNGFRPISDGRDESLPLVRVSALDRIEWYRPGFPSLTCRSFEEWVGGGLCDVAERSGAE